jgi:hypothetical protein
MFFTTNHPVMAGNAPILERRASGTRPAFDQTSRLPFRQDQPRSLLEPLAESVPVLADELQLRPYGSSLEQIVSFPKRLIQRAPGHFAAAAKHVTGHPIGMSVPYALVQQIGPLAMDEPDSNG